MLVLDAGNALFKTTFAGGDPQEKARAQLLLEEMDALGTTAMAVGARDLILGADFLRAFQKKGKMKLLSANLVDGAGKRLFDASTVVSVGGVKFGIVGVSPSGPVPRQDGLTGQPALPAVLAEARRLREKDKVDVVVVLAALPSLEASTLSLQSGKALDLILQSHDGRVSTLAQRDDYALFMTAGDRGRQLARAQLTVQGPRGPFVDLSQQDRAQQSLKIVEDNLAQARKSLAAARDASVQATWRETIAGLEQRKKELGPMSVPGGAKAGERAIRFSYVPLGSDIPDDPDIKARVERIEPPGSASH
ncbi:5'-nucleotidase [Archangium primigenium]|nr:5'-nucleotidase [Archangium primigenium]